MPPIVPSSLPNYLAEGLPKQDDEVLRDAREYIDELDLIHEYIQANILPKHRTMHENEVTVDADGLTLKGITTVSTAAWSMTSKARTDGGTKRTRIYQRSGTRTRRSGRCAPRSRASIR